VKSSPSIEPVKTEPTPWRKMELLAAEAEKWLGVREHGSNRGKEVEMFQREVDGKANGEAWCMSFCQFCVAEVDRRLAAEYEVYTKSEIYRTEHCLTCWNKTGDHLKVRPGAKSIGMMIIWQYFKGGKGTANGHVGIIHDVLTNGDIITVEGNTKDRNMVVRDGDGVYLMRRQIQYNGNFRVVGILRPW